MKIGKKKKGSKKKKSKISSQIPTTPTFVHPCCFKKVVAPRISSMAFLKSRPEEAWWASSLFWATFPRYLGKNSLGKRRSTRFQKLTNLELKRETQNEQTSLQFLWLEHLIPTIHEWQRVPFSILSLEAKDNQGTLSNLKLEMIHLVFRENCFRSSSKKKKTK